MKEIVLDTETTGLSVKEGHRIVEIGCIELDDLIPTKNVFHTYLNPERKVSTKALEVHGYTDEFLSDKKKFKDIADDFLKFIEGKELLNNTYIPLEQTIIVGDSMLDFTVSTALSIDCALLSNGHNNLERLQATGSKTFANIQSFSNWILD